MMSNKRRTDAARGRNRRGLTGGPAGLLLGMLIAAAPMAVQAQSSRIPNAELQGFLDRCVQRCTDTRSYGFCADMCGCMTHEIGRYWDMAEYQERISRLSADNNDPQVQGQIGRLASACGARANMPLSSIVGDYGGAAGGGVSGGVGGSGMR